MGRNGGDLYKKEREGERYVGVEGTSKVAGINGVRGNR